ncbi:hypothetical protein BB561_000584 [Smittium simulii]|uniref:K Homology domain-containing protein n=1 Tax=Smittium simulii TaxID=133385 RepID=A0A2T9YYF0_9FUNG|nr:hypothetical protein BB561_000584 [Smittium simulii]
MYSIDSTIDSCDLAGELNELSLSNNQLNFIKNPPINSISSTSPFPPTMNAPDDSVSKSEHADQVLLDSCTPNTEDSQLTLRALVTTREAGIVIGKGGKNVADLREISDVKAGVSKVIPGIYDRILSITGHLKDVARAYEFVANALVGNQTTIDTTNLSPILSSFSKPKHSRHVIIRILISHSLMGTIIGKQGLKIKNIQDKSGTKLIAAKEMLPQSTERVVEIHGPAESIYTAIYEIGKCLIEDWERGVGTVLYNPTARVPSVSSNSNPYVNNARSSMDYSLSDTNHIYSHQNTYSSSNSIGFPPGFSRQRSHTISATMNKNYNNKNYLSTVQSQFPTSNSMNTFEFPQSYDFPSESQPPSSTNNYNRIRSFSVSSKSLFNPPPPNIKTQEISIPSDMVGCIIGKAGSRISEIRRLSKTRIEIAKSSDPVSGERLFTITGTNENSDIALYLISGQLEAEKKRRLANAQLAADIESIHEPATN